jgi:pimeloyl-ACP methyl ester carboxylesterase
VIRFDVPGVGGSPLPARPYRFATLAWLLRGLLNKLGYQAANILGISWGGGLAQQFALSSPLRCRRLILVATATGPQTMVPGNPLVLAKMLTRHRYQPARACWLPWSPASWPRAARTRPHPCTDTTLTSPSRPSNPHR